MRESRRFEPPAELAANAVAREEHLRRGRDTTRLAFWESQAQRLTWATPWTQALDWSDAPFAKWFVGGKLNVAVNCLDRHVDAGYGDQVAYHWEGEPGDTRTITYAELTKLVCQAANALTELGVARRRPRDDLHADDPRDRRCHARLCPLRRTALRGVRRLLG